AFSSRSYGKTGSAGVIGAFGDGKLIQAFVGRQSFADEPVTPTAPSGRAASALPKTPFAIGRVATKATVCDWEGFPTYARVPVQ
ncbi:hypothetical protein, partial [Methylocaldum sp.]|uniref:hypothetical protein n=1 Tax=Methylocaldum sp. TaxID=1969727 RepID=UPI0032201002